MRLKATTIGILLVASGLTSSALTFGRLQGAAWIGRPLSLTVPVQMEPGQTAASLCAQADVFHADSKQDGSRVQVTVEPTAQADNFNVKVTSSAMVDEPVVTLYLRTGCEQKNTRRFVLLADYPTESAPVAQRLAAESLVQVPSVIPVETVAAAKAPVIAVATAAPAENTQVAPKPVPKPAPKAAVKPVAKPAAKAEPKPPVAPKVEVTKGPRLKLDALEVLAERIHTLETTTTAPVQPPSDVALDSQRIQQLQGDVKALLDQASKNEATLFAMRQRLEKAESDQVPMALVYGLVAMLVLALGGIGAMWMRRQKIQPWQVAPMGSEANPTASAAAVQPLSHDDVWQSHAATQPPVHAHLDVPEDNSKIAVDMIDMDDSMFAKLGLPDENAPSPTIERRVLVPAEEPSATMHPDDKRPDFNSDIVHDALQKAEFFAKLGKTDAAIEFLENHIRSDSKGSALLYLELLRIAHDKSLKTDFRQFSEEFQEVFNAKVPEFALFNDEGTNMEGRPELLQHIARLWPKPEVITVLESCILRDPFDKSPKPFDLAAFRDLVLMHGVASDLINPKAEIETSNAGPIDFEL